MKFYPMVRLDGRFALYLDSLDPLVLSILCQQNLSLSRCCMLGSSASNRLPLTLATTFMTARKGIPTSRPLPEPLS